jgi:hypothetical protein
MKFGYLLTPGRNKVMLIAEQTVLTYYAEVFEKKHYPETPTIWIQPSGKQLRFFIVILASIVLCDINRLE